MKGTLQWRLVAEGLSRLCEGLGSGVFRSSLKGSKTQRSVMSERHIASPGSHFHGEEALRKRSWVLQ